jgi:hypothetical protein
MPCRAYRRHPAARFRIAARPESPPVRDDRRRSWPDVTAVEASNPCALIPRVTTISSTIAWSRSRRPMIASQLRSGRHDPRNSSTSSGNHVRPLSPLAIRSSMPPRTEPSSANASVRLGPTIRTLDSRPRRPPRPSRRGSVLTLRARRHRQRPGPGPHGQSKVLRRLPARSVQQLLSTTDATINPSARPHSSAAVDSRLFVVRRRLSTRHALPQPGGCSSSHGTIADSKASARRRSRASSSS